jgi:peptidoglycan/LPS O-acetylase OafA/YrhL
MVWLLIKSKRIWPIGAFFLYIVPSVWLLISIILFNASPDSRNILGNLSHFVVGVAACFYTEMQNKSKVSFLKPLGKSLILIGGFFVLLCMVNYIYHANQLLFWYGGGELLVDLAILIIILAHDCFKQMDISVSPLIKLLSAFGVLSFGIYAWHGYVLTYYPLISDNFIIVLGVSLLLSWVSYTCIEVPISRFRRA